MLATSDDESLADELYHPASTPTGSNDLDTETEACDPAIGDPLECYGISSAQTLRFENEWEPDPSPGCPDCPNQLPGRGVGNPSW